MAIEFGGFDNMVEWASAVANRNRIKNVGSDSLEVWDRAVLWHLLNGTIYADMEAEMKVLRYRSKERYLERVIMPRIRQMGEEQQAALEAAKAKVLQFPCAVRS